MLSQSHPEVGFKLPADIFPTPAEIDEMLDQLSPDPIDASLAVIDPLVPPASAITGESLSGQLYDSRGFSSYSRVIEALLQVFIGDRQMAKQNTWAFRHFLALELYAQDFLSVPSAQSPMFDSAAPSAGLASMVSKVHQVTTYILTSAADDGWRGAALDVLLENKSAEGDGVLPALLVDAVKRSRDRDLNRDVRILRNILDHVLREITKDEADRWILLARKIESIGLCFSFFQRAFVVFHAWHFSSGDLDGYSVRRDEVRT